MREKITTEIIGASSALAFFKLTFLPDANLIVWVLLAVLFDFVTGIIKAIIQKEIRTSSGYRKTVIKLTQYMGAIAVGIILGNVLPKDTAVLHCLNSGMLIFLLYIEATSIFENLYAIDSSSTFSKYFIAPVLRILTLAVKRSSPNHTGNEK